MPYTAQQCKKFAVMAANGEKVPSDWREHCRKKKAKKPKKSGKKTT